MEGKHYDYSEAPSLPDFRVQKEFCFSYCGIDYARPLFVKNIYINQIWMLSINKYKNLLLEDLCMIKSVKRCLKKVVLNARLNYDKLLTGLKEIENIVNNRPLIYMYDDVNQEVLTSNKLLFGRNLDITEV